MALTTRSTSMTAPVGAAGGGVRHWWRAGGEGSGGAQAGQVGGGQPGGHGLEVRAADAVVGQVDGGGVDPDTDGPSGSMG
jgi:hypothetical protein